MFVAQPWHTVIVDAEGPGNHGVSRDSATRRFFGCEFVLQGCVHLCRPTIRTALVNRVMPQNRCIIFSARARVPVRASPMRAEIWRGGGTTRAKWLSSGRPATSENFPPAEFG